MSNPEIAAKGRELEQAEWKLPEGRRLDPELIALPDAEFRKKDPAMHKLWHRTLDQQAELVRKVNSPGAALAPQDIHRAHASQMAEELSVVIERVKKERDAAVVGTGPGDPAELQGALLALQQRRAESLATIGRYDLAAQVDPRPEYQKHYLAILDALYRDDSERCEHTEIRGSGEQSKVTVPSFNPVEDCWSIAHGRMVTLMKCSVPGCGFMNAIDPPEHVKRMRAYRARAHQLAGHLSPAAADAQLRKAGHTTSQLLGGQK